MSPFGFDWLSLFRPPSRDWLVTGLETTLAITIAGSVPATIVAIAVAGLRQMPGPGRWLAAGFIEIFRNTPLLVQLLFWYFAGFATLPRGLKAWVNDDHPWATLPGGVGLITPEFLVSAWGLGLFIGAYMAEEIRAGLAAIPPGQAEAATAQGFSRGQVLRLILLPQALANAWQPLVGQYLNLMKLSSLASAIGLAEITYQARQIESYNAHAIEAYAAATILYLAIGLLMGRLLVRLGPKQAGDGRPGTRRRLVLDSGAA